MKDLFKSLLLLISFFSAFLVGFYCGEEKFKTKIPDFQEEEKAD
jgi:hypothetical protein